MNDYHKPKKVYVLTPRPAVRKLCEKCKKNTDHRYIKDTNMRACENCYVGNSELEGE